MRGSVGACVRVYVYMSIGNVRKYPHVCTCNLTGEEELSKRRGDLRSHHDAIVRSFWDSDRCRMGETRVFFHTQMLVTGQVNYDPRPI